MRTDGLVIGILGLGYGGGGALIVERALARTPGVTRVCVNSATEMAYVRYDPAVLRPSDLVHVVEIAGFGASELIQRQEWLQPTV